MARYDFGDKDSLGEQLSITENDNKKMSFSRQILFCGIVMAIMDE